MFQSQTHPGLSMNRHGIVFAPNGDPRAVDYWGKSFHVAPLRPGQLDAQDEVRAEATAAGFKWRMD